MSFLFDENLSWRLVKRLDDLFPGSSHVVQLGLKHELDERVWQRARAEGLAIVSKDDDFRQRALLYGAPPKTIWVRLGNASTDEIEQAIRGNAANIRLFLADADEAIMILHAAS